MLATALLLIALHSPLASAVEEIRTQIEQVGVEIVVLQQKLEGLQGSQEKHDKVPAKLIEETRMQIDTAEQQLAYLETLLGVYLATPRHDPEDELRKQLEILQHRMDLSIPPEHPPSPRLKKST